MIPAEYSDKSFIVKILTDSFIENKSVNYVIKQDRKKVARLRALIDYSFEVCWHWGEVYLSDNRNGAALLTTPHIKKSGWRSIWLDAKLAVKAIGLFRVLKVLKREAKIKAFHPQTPYYYFWFMGVKPEEQGKGTGTSLMQDVIEESERRRWPIYGETSTLRNLPLYERFNLLPYETLDFGFTLFLMKREVEPVL